MIQERIPSAGNMDVMFAGYCNHQSRCLVSLTGEKLRSYPADAGMTSASRSTDNQKLRQLLGSFLSRLEYWGIVDLELRQDQRDGIYKLLDFNPRIGAQFRLYRNAAGIDVVQAMHLDLTGRVVPQTAEPRQRSYVVENYELALFLKTRRKGRLRLREWLRSLPGEREFAWFSCHDLMPFLMMCIAVVGNIIRDRLWPANSLPSITAPRYRAGRCTVPTKR
jgi:D-aspartate ligase